VQRLGYSSIKSRPRLQWPDGARVALWVTPNIEFYEYLPAPDAVRPHFAWRARSPHPDIVSYGVRDYGNRVALWRFIDLMDKHGIRPTASINAAVFDHFPEITQALEQRRWDYMCHGVYNTQYVWDMDIETERAVIADGIETYRRHTGRMLAGWIGPGLSNTVNTPDLVAEAGIKYYGDFGQHDDQPFPLRVRQGRLITLPYSSNLGDAINERQGHEAEEFARFIVDYFDTLYEEGCDQGRVLAINLHPFIIGQPHRIGHLDRALTYICSHPGVWKATGEAIADWYYAHYWDEMVQFLPKD
jgi:peptidoglycan/xylan/chitin deacetylase (PgdA/CDA1 family)